ncbi:MLO-like protein [Melia azedarach]|uniref:MLO-like protein n=1 Tax=Melia azedarach TaxID=155640 RepID=A0ACC1XRR1_MELAZ|nr:MLO-like protein [Melia azedarach]
MEEDKVREGRSFAETPNWAVATVITVLVVLGFFVHTCLKHFGKWLDKTKRKSLLAALDKIKDELMLFGLLSLLMGHWIIFVAKICVKSSLLSSRFYPCANKADLRSAEHSLISSSRFLNMTLVREQVNTKHRPRDYCPEGLESFASYESLEQLHRFIFLLGITHVSYSFVAIALAMIKIYSWRIWENQAKTMAVQSVQDSSESASSNRKMVRLSTFIFHHTSHPWSQHGVLVWMLCFTRQFWSSIGRADYMALRLGFITTHELPLTYDFHKYMLRSMEEEFRDIVGISLPLWIYAIFCIFLNFHGTNAYLWLSFLPAILILLIGTKLHRVVVKLAVEIMDICPWMGNREFNLRDDLFWFGKPKLLLHLIQLISFQNALEMATFLWSLWEIKESSCFMENHSFVIIRLTFGIVSQCWCSFITFPLYVIITQMGSRLKRSVISENVRTSLSTWKKRARAKQRSSIGLLSATSTTSLDSLIDDMNKIDDFTSTSVEESSSTAKDSSVLHQDTSGSKHPIFEVLPFEEEKLEVSLHSDHLYHSFHDDHDDQIRVEKDDICLIPP